MATIKPTKLGLVNIELKDTTYINVQSKCTLLGIVTFEDVLRQNNGKIDYVVLYNKITPNSDATLDIWYKMKSGDDLVFIADEWVATMSNVTSSDLTHVVINIPVISEPNFKIVKQLLKTLEIDFSTSQNINS